MQLTYFYVMQIITVVGAGLRAKQTSGPVKQRFYVGDVDPALLRLP